MPVPEPMPDLQDRRRRYVLQYSDKKRRLAGRRREQETTVFKERYAMRSGIESTNSGLKNRLGLGNFRFEVGEACSGWSCTSWLAGTCCEPRPRRDSARGWPSRWRER